MTYEPLKGEMFYSAAKNAIELAKTNNSNVNFTFNGIYIIVSPKSYTDDISQIYHLECQIRKLEAQLG